ncbi:sensor histidine kinase [Arsenicibacter rosenii]|uniref:histidine kinase n=1 Tax=Arsenicibacter rosenii TaxID=1750698 RepID=A0A1S2VIL0_9BACT|nr:ATP-binding protein [Arsenicibacter rosenii]OIN58579.1 two-component sensor histidine kinase [Arsenicibacter rosenii]
MINIRTRLTYQFVVLVTGILLFFSLGVYFFSKLYLQKRFFKRLQDRAITTTTLLFDLQTADTTVMRLVDLSNKEPLINENISVYSEQLNKVVFTTNPANATFHEQFIPRLRKAAQTAYIHFGDYQILGLYLSNSKGNSWVIVSGIDQNGREALEDLRKILIVMVLAGILLLSISGWFFAGRALAPMSGIVQQVKTIFPANVGKRVDHPNKSDEIGVLVATFNQLLDRIEQALLTQKMFIANVSHELKNPLARLYAQIDVTLMQKRTPEVYENSLRLLQDDTRSLTQLTNTLLALANTVADGRQLPFAAIRLDELLWEAKAQVRKWRNEYQIDLHFDEFPDNEDELLIHGNEAALKVLFMNLLDNACKFSTDKTARIHFSANAGGLTVSVFNRGNPIPQRDLPHIFQPFYRSDATAQATKGHGVGLAIVAQIVDLHKGAISVDSTEEGTRFTLLFRH